MGIKSKTTMDKIKRNNPYFEDFITRSVYHSNAIEGNTISYAETYALIFNSNDLKINASPREIYEAINLKYALNFILNTLDRELSLEYIKKIGIYINKNINDIDDFRKTQVFIRGAEHIPPAPQYVRSQLSELIYRGGKQKEEDVFHYLARFHISFERIHPFVDGNGRTGRLLITKELLKRGYAPVVIPLEIRAEYMRLLAISDISGLAILLERLNSLEIARMHQFGIRM